MIGEWGVGRYEEMTSPSALDESRLRAGKSES
jgi:hypothetical protein